MDSKIVAPVVNAAVNPAPPNSPEFSNPPAAAAVNPALPNTPEISPASSWQREWEQTRTAASSEAVIVEVANDSGLSAESDIWSKTATWTEIPTVRASTFSTSISRSGPAETSISQSGPTDTSISRSSPTSTASSFPLTATALSASTPTPASSATTTPAKAPKLQVALPAALAGFFFLMSIVILVLYRRDKRRLRALQALGYTAATTKTVDSREGASERECVMNTGRDGELTALRAEQDRLERRLRDLER
ncbi:hypothetical protein EDC01DRAFT_650422 [Geopyxis carbonaria]|nr:hypothetical protein EDC01DRAFT_650422 [Geopyxis carbonaria]